MTRPPRHTARRQRGFIPGLVIEINVSLAILGVVVAVLWTWSTAQFYPPAIEPMRAELVPPAASAGGPPAGWRIKQEEGGATVVRREVDGWESLAIPALLVATLVIAFVAPLHWPYWLLLALLCGTWGFGIWLGPGDQELRIGPDGSVAARGSTRLGFIVLRGENVFPRDVEGVLVHKERPEAYLVFRKNETRRGWPIYAGTLADARGIAAAIQPLLKIQPGKPTPGAK